jgi:ribosomal protein S18 acetylase RimI-like enzyme
MKPPTIALTTADTLTRADLAELLNRAFADYLVPVQLSVAELESTIERDDILLRDSYVASLDGDPVGVALVAVRPWRGGTRSRLATMGVAPAGRRRGVARHLLRRVVDEARARGSRQLLLEVLADNAPARLLYEGAGFEPRRRLLGFTLPAASLRARAHSVVRLRPIDGRVALTLFAACTAGELPDAAPAWQLDAPALARFGPPTALYAVEADGALGAVGYLVLGEARPSAGLVHIGIVPVWRRRGLGTAALAVALARHPDVAELHVPPLIPEVSSLVPFLQALGAARETEEQIEMALPLDP